MRLQLPFPADWQVIDGQEGAVVGRAPGTPERSIAVSAVEPLPPIVDAAWLRGLLARDLPAAAELAIERADDDRSARGWPVTVVVSSVRAGGKPIEPRVSVVYRLLDRFAIAELRGPGGDAERTLLMAGELDWTSPVCSLAQIYGFGPDHAIFAARPASEA
jgi:hypothetical protein